jgi:alcohol dehydrogenase YqhD (iron-dependent ADH family)
MVDIMSHVLEQYYHNGTNTVLQDAYCESLLKTVINTVPRLLNDLTSLDIRETILYSGTMALNGILSMGFKGDWATHNLEHAVSAIHDIPHGGGLETNVERSKRLAIEVFGVDPSNKSDKEVAEADIQALREFWISIGAPSWLADYDIDASSIELMADKAMIYGDFGNFQKLTRADIVNIYKMSL